MIRFSAETMTFWKDGLRQDMEKMPKVSEAIGGQFTRLENSIQ